MTLSSAKRGFTLIELLVVIAIIGILSSVVLASLGTAREKARDATRISDVKNVQLALELYYDSLQAYPPNTVGTANAYGMGGTALVAALVPTYIPRMPEDPSSARVAADRYHYVGLDAAGADCSVVAGCASYAMGAYLERADNGVLDTDVDNVDYAGFYSMGLAGCGDSNDGVANTERCYSIRP